MPELKLDEHLSESNYIVFLEKLDEEVSDCSSNILSKKLWDLIEGCLHLECLNKLQLTFPKIKIKYDEKPYYASIRNRSQL